MEITNNRRRYFRIDDVVELNYKIIDEHKVTESRHITENILSACSLSTALEIVSQESAGLLRRMEKSQPDIAHYIKLQDKMIDLLARAVISLDSRTDKKNILREVNMSASGLAFYSDEAIDIGFFLELSIVLVSLGALISTCCRVVDCKKNQSADSRLPYRISVDFVNMKDDDRDLLIKHQAKRQMLLIREKKDNSKNHGPE